MTKSFSMKVQSEIGEHGAKIQDKIWSQYFIVTEASIVQDRRKGIDRIVQLKDSASNTVPPHVWNIQYKLDTWINTSGNCAVEYLSNDESMSDGGWLSTEADIISVLNPETETCYLLDAQKLKVWFVYWWTVPRSKTSNKYNRKACPQEHGGQTWNLLVPLKDMAGVFMGTISASEFRLAAFTV